MLKNLINSSFSAPGQVLIGNSSNSFTVVPAPTAGPSSILTSDAGLTSTLIGFENVLNFDTSWMPTVQGSTTPGTATYSTQVGVWCNLGELAMVWGIMDFSSFTGTGDLQVVLPITVGGSAATNFVGPCIFTGTFTSGSLVDITAIGAGNFALLTVYGSGSGPATQSCVAAGFLQFLILYSLN